MTTEDLIRKYFEPPTTIQMTLWGTYRITTPDGSLEFSETEGFSKVAGGSGTIRGVALMGGELFGTVKANGPPEFVAALVAHCELLHIPTQPEAGNEADAGCLIVMMMFACLLAFALTAWIVLPDPVPAWADWLTGLSAAALANLLFGQAIRSACERERRRRGAARYLNPFPELHERTSAREVAKRKGML